MFYVETQIGRKPQNVFSYMSWRITFIGSTNFLFFPTVTGRRFQPHSFLGYNLREAPTLQFSGYNQKEATTTCPCFVQPPWSRSRMMEPLSHYHCEIYLCKPVPINMNHASTMHQPIPQHVINLYHKQVHQPCTNLYQTTCNQPIP